MPDPADKSPPEQNPPLRAVVFGFLFAVALAVAGFVLVKALVDMVSLQNCALTGRTNC